MNEARSIEGAGNRKSVTGSVPQRRRRYHLTDIGLRAGAVILLLAGVVVILMPLIWMFSTSLKSDAQIFSNPPQWVPQPFVLSHFQHVFEQAPMFLWTRNTVFITLTTLVGATFSSSIVGYGFACLRARGRSTMFYLMLSTIMLPGIVVLLPQFILFSYIGWIDTFYPLIVPTFFGIPFYIFLFRQFFLALPRELVDAARIDGAGYLTVWWRIFVPLAIPAHVTVATFQFIAAWNDFLAPYVYLTSSDHMTLSLGTQYFLGLHGAQWGELMAMSVIMMIPMIIAFAFGQQYFVRGISTTGFGGR